MKLKILLEIIYSCQRSELVEVEDTTEDHLVQLPMELVEVAETYSDYLYIAHNVHIGIHMNIYIHTHNNNKNISPCFAFLLVCSNVMLSSKVESYCKLLSCKYSSSKGITAMELHFWLSSAPLRSFPSGEISLLPFIYIVHRLLL